MTNRDKLNFTSQMGDRGVMYIDELREVWNLPPLPNGLGQRIPRRGEYYFVDPENPQDEEEQDNAD